MSAEHTPHSELRAKIVAALNLTPLVPPNADTETLNVVEDAWAALSELMRSVEQYEVVKSERDEYWRLLDAQGVHGLREQVETLEEMLRSKSKAFVEMERAKEQYQALDRFVRETISVWDAKGPLIASEELRERYDNFLSNPATERRFFTQHTPGARPGEYGWRDVPVADSDPAKRQEA